jgi:hypothetical protein
LLAAVCFLSQYFQIVSAEWNLGRQALGLTITIAVGASVFFGTAYLLRVGEVRDVVELVRGKLRGARVA